MNNFILKNPYFKILNIINIFKRTDVFNKVKGDMLKRSEIVEGLNTTIYKVESIEKNYIFTRIIYSFDKSFYSVDKIKN